MNLALQLNNGVQKKGLANFVFNTEEEQKGIKSLTFDELKEIEGGAFHPVLLAIGAAAAACVAIYEAGKATGEFIYYATH
ncbi:MAG: class IIb bacteriocin, lactobin A/cerein 7B family [Capnocytophaga sp.]|nr:class IIb bacteriocin, lactobin A/cerein 7B family [Capnocytophaga sp.]